jgi:capsular polysaccharide biosynthesis protein
VFTVSFRFNVGLEPVPPIDATYEYNPLDVWKTSEYFMDDLASAVRGQEYARRVAARMQEHVNLGGIFGASTDHRVLTVSAVWGDGDQLAQIANAAVLVLEQEGQDLVGPVGRARPVLRLIDPPTVVPMGQSLKDKLDIPIRLGLAFVAGIAGTFLLDYLDTSVRDDRELETMGISIVGRIPPHK